MDLRDYYMKIRTLEASLTDKDVIICSLDTPEGGKAGVLEEVPKYTAAKLVVEGRARLATEEEASGYREEATTRYESHKTEKASRVQLSVIPEAELKVIRTALKGLKSN